MTNNEKELLNIFCDSSDLEHTVLTAIKVFSAFLAQLEEVQEPPAASPPESS